MSNGYSEITPNTARVILNMDKCEHCGELALESEGVYMNCTALDENFQCVSIGTFFFCTLEHFLEYVKTPIKD